MATAGRAKRSDDAMVGKRRRQSVELYVLENVSHSPRSTKTAVFFLACRRHMQSKHGLMGGWKVRRRQCQRVRVGLAPPQTTQYNNVPCAEQKKKRFNKNHINSAFFLTFCLFYVYVQRRQTWVGFITMAATLTTSP